MSGSLTAHPTPGGGLTLRLTLPRAATGRTASPGQGAS